jgi:hypothetical protein
VTLGEVVIFMAVSGQYLISAIAIAAQPYAMIAYGIARRRRGDSPPQRFTGAILGGSVLAATIPVIHTAFLTVSMGEPLLLCVSIGFILFDLVAAVFILGLIPVAFVVPTILILWAAINLLFALRIGNALFILPSVAFSALALRSIARTVRRRGEAKAT